MNGLCFIAGRNTLACENLAVLGVVKVICLLSLINSSWLFSNAAGCPVPEPEDRDWLRNVRLAQSARGKELKNVRNTLDPAHLLQFIYFPLFNRFVGTCFNTRSSGGCFYTHTLCSRSTDVVKSIRLAAVQR